MEREMSIKDALKEGKTGDELLAQFKQSLFEAERELARERASESKKNKELEKAREKMLDAAIDYTRALGFGFEDTDYDEAKDRVRDAVIEFEKDAKERLGFMRMMHDILSNAPTNKSRSERAAVPNMKEVDSATKIIDEFLRTL